MKTTTQTTTSNETVNVVRVSKGAEWERYEATKGCRWVVVHTSGGKVLELTLDVARARQMKRVAAEGWRIETV